MITNKYEDNIKLVSIHKRYFLTKYEFVYGSDEVKSYIKRIAKRRGKYPCIDEPVFDIIE